jgi:glucan biosynthesis protein C
MNTLPMNPLPRIAPRRADLDWVRVGAFGLLILYHVGMAFVTWDWHIKTAHPSTTIEPLMILLNPWRLSLLFFISGCATRFMAGRLSAGVLARQRLGRLGIPLLFGMAVIVPPQSWVQVREHGYQGGYLAFYEKYLTFYRGFCDAHSCLTVPTWNHLWFVAYLLAYTLLLCAVLGLARLLPRICMPAATAPSWLVAMLVLAGPPLWLCAARGLLAVRFPETHAFVGDWYAHAIYAPLFLLGFFAAPLARFWQAAQSLRGATLAMALTAYATMATIWLIYPGDAVPPAPLMHAYRILYGIDQWAWILAILGFAHRHLHRGGPVLTYLTQGVFPFYIMHQTIIVMTEYWLKRHGLPAPLEGAILVATTVAGCFASYEIIRRVRLLRPLFGLRGAAAQPSQRWVFSAEKKKRSFIH